MDFNKRLLFCFIIILLAYFYQFIISNKNTKSIEQELIESWDEFINLPEENKNLTILLGFNTNVDLIVSAIELFQSLNLTSNLECCVDHKIITSLNDFKQLFLYYFRRGSAAERFFLNQNDFMHVIEATESIDKKWFIGGNAALMAQSISNIFPQTKVILIGPIGQKLRDMLNKNILTPTETYKDNDEIHLILEYARNVFFEGLQSPSANRFIVSNDFFNSRMEMLDLFFNLQINFEKIDRIILAGLHLLEAQSKEFRQDKLQLLNKYLSKLDGQIIHLELASIGNKDFMNEIVDSGILAHINSLGLNEQELLFFSYAKNGPHSDYFKEIQSQPDLEKIIDILEWIFLNFGRENSKLSRIHFHSLTYHIIGITDSSNWGNVVSSLLSGSKIASKQACDNSFHEKTESFFHSTVEYRFINSEKFLFSKTNPFVELKRKNIRFYLTPVLVCKNPLKTVGLGDAISSTGLIYSTTQ